MKIRHPDTVSSIGKQEFERSYLRKQEPLVIRRLASDFPAQEKWTLHYMKEKCGDLEVEIFDNEVSNHGTAYTSADLRMKFADYADQLIKNEPTSYRMFLFNMFRRKPELRKDFPCPDIFKGILGRIGYMFFGSKGINVRIHQDIDMSNVLLTQFCGKKRVILIAPEYSRLLYKLPFNTHSLVDLDHPDYHKYPGLRYIEAYECILDHGDSLFIPGGYWHYITYLDGGFAVSYRKVAQGARGKMLGLLSLFVYMPLDKLLHASFGVSWLAYKERLAEIRANRAIRRIQRRSQGPDIPIGLPAGAR
jgi:hypothetical protein